MRQNVETTNYVINEKVKIKIPHPIRNVLISAGVLLMLLIAGGVFYTFKYGANEKADKTAAPKPQQAGPEVNIAQPGPNAPVGVSVTYITAPVKRGENALLNIHTNPKASCTIAVTNDVKTALKDSGLITKTSDARGNVAWSWTVGLDTPPGKWQAQVYCSVGKKSGMVIGNFEVQ